MLKLHKYRLEIFVLLSFILIGIIEYKKLGPLATANDITVSATLRRNNTDKSTHKEYLLDIDMTIDRNSPVIIYPYIEGLGAMSFLDSENEDYYIPDSIGSDGFTESIALKALEDNLYVDINEDTQLIGVWAPEEAGQYKMRFYFDQLEDIKVNSNPVLVCVFKEERFGKDVTWSKIIPITIE